MGSSWYPSEELPTLELACPMHLKAFWRDVRFLQILAQVLFVVVLAAAAGFLYANVSTNLSRQGLTVGLGFLRNPANFDIGEQAIPYQPSNSYGRAILVGLMNTLSVSAWGIVLATIVGVIAGVARLSTNWLVNKFAATYVGVIRNTPLIIQLMFWYFGIILQLPGVRDAFSIPGPIFLSNRGLYLPWPLGTETLPSWLPFWGVAFSLVVLFRLFFWALEKRMDRPIPFWWQPLAYLVMPGIVLWAGAALLPVPPLAVSLPRLSGLNFAGGLRLTPEFAALLFGLVTYTGAFIAEVVRAGIQSVSRGQAEAARSLGLPPGLLMRLVIFPQALRLIIPPLTSQYLNLAKNSSLAIAIGYPDLFSVAGTVFNQTGAAVEIILIMMISYLMMSLFTSLLMNIYNSRTRLVER